MREIILGMFEFLSVFLGREGFERRRKVPGKRQHSRRLRAAITRAYSPEICAVGGPCRLELSNGENLTRARN
jgi:hypothetical protein